MTPTILSNEQAHYHEHLARSQGIAELDMDRTNEDRKCNTREQKKEGRQCS